MGYLRIYLDIYRSKPRGNSAAPNKRGKQMEKTSFVKVLEHRGLFTAVLRFEKNGAPFLMEYYFKKGFKDFTLFGMKEAREMERGANSLKKMYGIKGKTVIEFINVVRGEA